MHVLVNSLYTCFLVFSINTHTIYFFYFGDLRDFLKVRDFFPLINSAMKLLALKTVDAYLHRSADIYARNSTQGAPDASIMLYMYLSQFTNGYGNK